MISAVILGAGESKRMGEQNKLLLPFGKKTLIETIVENVIASKVQEVLVVLGHEADRVQGVLQGYPVRWVHNPQYQEGMTTSIQAGVGEVSSQAEGVMVCLSDLPHVQPSDLDLLIERFEQARPTHLRPIVLPTFEGQRGNPVIFSIYYKSQILSHPRVNGCRGVIQRNPDQVIPVEMPASNILMDIDTPTDYKKAIQSR